MSSFLIDDFSQGAEPPVGRMSDKTQKRFLDTKSVKKDERCKSVTTKVYEAVKKVEKNLSKIGTLLTSSSVRSIYIAPRDDDEDVVNEYAELEINNLYQNLMHGRCTKSYYVKSCKNICDNAGVEIDYPVDIY